MDNKYIKEIHIEIDNLNDNINQINKDIDEIHHNIEYQEEKYQTIIENQRLIVTGKVEKNYQDDININFPVAQKILQLTNKHENINKLIKQYQKSLNKHTYIYTEITNEINNKINNKSKLTIELKQHENQIRDISNNTNILKKQQINNLFDTIHNDMNIKLNKWQHRKQYLIYNNHILFQRKIIKEQLREIDKEIKVEYWKMVKNEIDKNKRLNTLLSQYKTNCLNINVNNEIYTHIDIPVHQILNQHVYNKFKKQLENINKSEPENNIKYYKEQLNILLKKYKDTLYQLKTVEINNHQLVNINNIYDKYQLLQKQLKTIDQDIILENQKSILLNNEIQNIKNDILKLNDDKTIIMNQINNYQQNNQFIINKEVDNKLEKYKIKMNINKRHQINEYKNQLVNLQSQKTQLEHKLIELSSYLQK